MGSVETGGGGWSVARAVIKVVSLLVGAVATLVCGMALSGRFVESGWARASMALVVMLVVPAVLSDRLLPKDDPARGKGLPSDVFALTWLGFPVAFAVALGFLGRPLLLVEAERQSASGNPSLAAVAAALAGGTAQASPGEVTTPSPEPSASAELPESAASASLARPADSALPPPSASVASPEEPAVRGRKPGELGPAELFKKLAPSVVTIAMVSDEQSEVGGGTGFLIDRAGTIVTNHHVIDSGPKLVVKFMDGAIYEDVTLLAEDPAVDLALLRVVLSKPKRGKAPKFDPLDLGDSDKIVVGERAISIGNPLGLDHTLTDGLVSARRMRHGRQWIQMSVPVSPGNSGGPLFNMRGEVIGVTTAQIGALFGRAQNLNLAIPVNVVRQHVRSDYPGARPFGERPSSSHW